MGRRKQDAEVMATSQFTRQRRNSRDHEAHKEDRHLQGRLYYWRNKTRKEHPEWAEEAIQHVAMEHAAAPRVYKARQQVAHPPPLQTTNPTLPVVGDAVTTTPMSPESNEDTKTDSPVVTTVDTNGAQAAALISLIPGARLLKDGTVVIRIKREPWRV
jgi:hypothetical protein